MEVASQRRAASRPPRLFTGDLFLSVGVPRNSAHPNSAKLFVAFMTTREAQGVMKSMTCARPIWSMEP